MAKLAGKFARFQASGTAINGPFRWGAGFKRERLDTTNFESAVDAGNINVFSEGLTGVVDTTFTVEGWIDDTTLNVFYPSQQFTADFLFRKNVSLGYKSVAVDVLDFSPGTAAREAGKFTAQMQASGLVGTAA